MRKLSPAELMYHLFDRVGNVNFIVTARLEAHLTRLTLRSALDAVQARHPLLNFSLENGKLYPGREAIPLIITKNKLESVIEKEMVRHVRGPPMRCTWIPGDHHNLVLTFHHATSDATSGMNILEDLLKASSGNALKVRPLPPSIEEILPLDVKGIRGFIKVLRAYLIRYRHQLISGRVRRFPIQIRVDWTKQTRRVISRRIDHLASQRLFEQARSSNTTIHAALTAAFLLAFSRSQNKSMTLGPTSMLGLREYLKKDVKKDVGMFVSLVPTIHRISPSLPLWDIAREIKQRLHSSIKRGDALAALPLLRMLVPLLSRLSDDKLYQRLNSLFPTTITISNLGRLQLEESYDEFILKEVDFAISPFGETAIAVAASTFARCLTLNVSFIEPLIDRNFAEQLTDDAIALLDVLPTSI